MEHVNGWCFRGIYKGGLWENDLHVSAHIVETIDTNTMHCGSAPGSAVRSVIYCARGGRQFYDYMTCFV